MLTALLVGQLLTSGITWTGPRLSPAEAAAVLARSPGAANFTGKRLTPWPKGAAIVLPGPSRLGDPRWLTNDWEPVCCDVAPGGLPWFGGYPYAGPPVGWGYAPPPPGLWFRPGRQSLSSRPVRPAVRFNGTTRRRVERRTQHR
jgi:hypothetical protein